MRDTLLVLGCGQIGTDITAVLADRFDVHVHCRRRESVVAVTEETGIGADRAWFGDLIDPSRPLGRLDGPSPAGAGSADDHGPGHRLSWLIGTVGADVVVDTTNIATSTADPLIAPTADGTADAAIASAAAVVRDRAAALHRLLRRGPVRRYVRVSTTGLGIRGLELPFTHGDSGAFMSQALWHKVLFAGMEHQTLWALARSFPGRVNLVVPAVFVGFERFEELTGSAWWDRAGSASRDGATGTLAAGEDRAYTAEELAVLSSPYQMGATTRRDVAHIVADLVAGYGGRYDVLAAMTGAALTASVGGHQARAHMLDRLRAVTGEPWPIAAGALGIRVSRALILLRLVRLTRPGSPWSWLADGASSAPPVGGGADNASVSEAVRHAAKVGVPLTTVHPTPDTGATCVCARCLDRLVAGLRDRLRAWYRTASTSDRLAFRDVAAGPHWREGDVLAVLWHGAGAEDTLL